MTRPVTATESREARGTRLRAFLKILVSLVLIVWLLYRIGPANIWESIAAASVRWIVISILFFVISNLLGAMQWHMILLNRRVHLSLFQGVKLYHIGLFFNNFLLGNVGGDAFRIYDIRRISQRTETAFSTVFLDRFIGFFALTTLAMGVAGVMAYRVLEIHAVYTISLVFLGWLFAMLFLFFESFAAKFGWLSRLLLPAPVHLKAKAFYYNLHAFRHEKKMLLQVFTISLVIQTLRILTHWSAARALGLNVALGYFFLFIPIVALLASLPISLGGLGVREQSAVTLFAHVGLSSAQIVAFELLAYIVGILATLPGGLFFAMRKH
jgi:uncharacterized protein (TIRG00374 family)